MNEIQKWTFEESVFCQLWKGSDPMTPSEKITAFLAKDNAKLEEIIEKHPQQIPIHVVAELFGCSQDTLRTALQEQGLLGIAERRPGKLNRGFVIPTAHFVRWYMCQWRY